MKIFTTTLVKKDGKLDFSSNAIKKVYDVVDYSEIVPIVINKTITQIKNSK